VIHTNGKAGRGGNPIQLDSSSFNKKKIASDRREINGKRDYASEKYRLLKLHAGIRYNDLGRLVSYRRRHRLELGTEAAWAAVLANLTECFGTSADAYSINALARRLGLPRIDCDVAAAACRSADGIIMSAFVAGKLLQVLRCERTAANVRSLEAIDEPADERKRRLNRARQQKRRAVTRHNITSVRDTRRRTASPALRALTSSSSIRLASRQEPQPLSFPTGKKTGRDAPRQASEISDRAFAPQARLAGSRPPICEPFDLFQPSNPEPWQAKPSLSGEQNDQLQTTGYPSYRTRLGTRRQTDNI
jgi:hypothetical protein